MASHYISIERFYLLPAWGRHHLAGSERIGKPGIALIFRSYLSMLEEFVSLCPHLRYCIFAEEAAVQESKKMHGSG
jgi:hypothetical protein